jgi:integrase
MDMPRGVRVRAGRIEINYQRDGRRVYETLDGGDVSARAIAQAARLRKQRIVDLAAGITPAAIERENPRVDALAQDYLDALPARNVAPSTIDSYRDILNRYWLPHVGALRVREVRYRDLLAAAGATEWSSGKTYNNALVPLRGVFRLAMADDLIDADPSAKLARAKRQAPDVDPVTPTEWAAIVAYLDGDARDWLSLVWETGLRTPSEVAALTWGDVDLDGGRLTVSKGVVRREAKASTKTNTAREVLLTPGALAVLRARPTRFRADGPVFWRPPSPYLPDGGAYLDGDEINDAWRAAVAAAGVRPRRAYNLRHGFASRALTAGANPAWLAQHLGHSLEMLLNVYGKWLRGAQDRAELAKLDVAKRGGSVAESAASVTSD